MFALFRCFILFWILALVLPEEQPNGINKTDWLHPICNLTQVHEIFLVTGARFMNISFLLKLLVPFLVIVVLVGASFLLGVFSVTTFSIAFFDFGGAWVVEIINRNIICSTFYLMLLARCFYLEFE